MAKLSWNDVLIDSISAEQFQSWMSPWSGILAGKAAPAFMTGSATGSCIVQKATLIVSA